MHKIYANSMHKKSFSRRNPKEKLGSLINPLPSGIRNHRTNIRHFPFVTPSLNRNAGISRCLCPKNFSPSPCLPSYPA
jgi:hypothetical protein